MVLCPAENIHDLRLVTRAVGLHGIGAHDARAGVAMDDLVAKDVRQELPFVNENARRRTCAGVQQVRYNARIELVPLVKYLFVFRRAFGSGLGPGRFPARAAHFVVVAEVAEFHHVVDAHAPIAIVVIV